MFGWLKFLNPMAWFAAPNSMASGSPSSVANTGSPTTSNTQNPSDSPSSTSQQPVAPWFSTSTTPVSLTSSAVSPSPNDWEKAYLQQSALVETLIGQINSLSQELAFLKGEVDGLSRSSGPQGPSGSQGPQGEQGDTGPRGRDGQDGSDGRDGATGPAGPQGPQGNTGLQGPRGATGPQGPQGEPGLSGGNNPASIEVVDGSISVGWEMDRPNNSLRYILRDPDGIDRDTFADSTDMLLFQSGYFGTENVFGDIPIVEVFVSSAEAVDSLSSAYSTIEFEVTSGLDDYVDWSLYISELWLPFRDAKGYAEFVALPIEFTPVSVALELDAEDGATYLVEQGSSYSFSASGPPSSTITYEIYGNPPGITIESGSGLITIDPLLEPGSYTITITATSEGEGLELQTDTESYVIQVTQPYAELGDYFSAFGAQTQVTGTVSADIIIFGNFAAYEQGLIEVDGLGGDDVIRFGEYAASGIGSQLLISNASGSQEYSFGTSPGSQGGYVSMLLGDGDHNIYLGGYAGYGNGTFEIWAGDGDHIVDLGNAAGGYGGECSILVGDGNHVFNAGAGGMSGKEGRLEIEAGDGAQIYNFGDDSGRDGELRLKTGVGPSVFNFGDIAARHGGEIVIDLGADTDADSVFFDGLVGNIFIQNYSITYDDKVDVVVPSTWSGTDNGTDIVFTQSDQTITFEGLGGLGGSTDPLDYFM